MAHRTVSVSWVITCLSLLPMLTVQFGGPACSFALFNDEQGTLVTIALSAPGCCQPSWHWWQGCPPIMGRMSRTDGEREKVRGGRDDSWVLPHLSAR